MPLRNPFRKGVNGVDINDENRRAGPDHGFKQTPVIAARPLDIKDAAEYKLSEINDSGVFLPPSPPEKKSFWKPGSSTTTPSNHRSVLGEIEPFNISRESFESYRRSFDISARAPMPQGTPRQSLDSRRQRMPRSSISDQRISFERQQPTVEEGFEEVGLNDDPKPKKRSIFSRFGDNADANGSHEAKSPTSNHSTNFHFMGRKRGMSGQGSELKSMTRPTSGHTNNVPTVAVDS
jgi:hypothetical protein